MNLKELFYTEVETFDIEETKRELIAQDLDFEFDEAAYQGGAWYRIYGEWNHVADAMKILDIDGEPERF
jgi:hypothetical protein